MNNYSVRIYNEQGKLFVFDIHYFRALENIDDQAYLLTLLDLQIHAHRVAYANAFNEMHNAHFVSDDPEQARVNNLEPINPVSAYDEPPQFLALPSSSGQLPNQTHSCGDWTFRNVGSQQSKNWFGWTEFFWFIVGAGLLSWWILSSFTKPTPVVTGDVFKPKIEVQKPVEPVVTDPIVREPIEPVVTDPIQTRATLNPGEKLIIYRQNGQQAHVYLLKRSATALDESKLKEVLINFLKAHCSSSLYSCAGQNGLSSENAAIVANGYYIEIRGIKITISGENLIQAKTVSLEEYSIWLKSLGIFNPTFDPDFSKPFEGQQ